ncbi:MAG: glycosyltransferase [Pseudomonas sp.]
MIILISSKIGQADIQASLGKPEYSYFFLMQEFIPALQQLGSVIEVNSHAEVDALFEQHRLAGRPVVFLSFSPPHQTPVGLRCPTLSVFAWEFDSLPDEAWDNDPRNDWRYVFARNGATITLSQESATTVRAAMGADFPVLAVPAPIWSRFAGVYPPEGWLPGLSERAFCFTGQVIDSPILGLSADGLVRKPEPVVAVAEVPAKRSLSLAEKLHTTRLLWKNWLAEISQSARPERPETKEPELPPVEILQPEPDPAPAEPKREPLAQVLSVQGVVYVSVLNPGDGRKNWVDLITAFCWAFKEVADATLVVKMTHHDLEYYRVVLMTLLSRLAPFKCRVLVLHGYLTDEQYRELIRVSDYYVNASACEGLCLPLMEFLSAGKPVLGPVHTAMSDYLNPDLAFLVQSSPEPSCWSHDPTGKLRTRRYRLNWESLMDAYRSSYRVAKEQPEIYRAMSQQAFEQMRGYCSTERVAGRLGAFLRQWPGILPPVEADRSQVQ